MSQRRQLIRSVKTTYKHLDYVQEKLMNVAVVYKNEGNGSVNRNCDAIIRLLETVRTGIKLIADVM